MKPNRSWLFARKTAEAHCQVDWGGAHPSCEHLSPHRGRVVRLLNQRSKDGSLLSVRIPVTRANRRLLRALRAAELTAWQAADGQLSRTPSS